MDEAIDQPLLTIGAFARAVGLTPSALRHYDECGLLRPAEVDDATGYRYYTPDLAHRAQAVARMREAGFPIEVMRTALDGSADERRRALARVRAEQEALAERRAALLEALLAGEASASEENGPVSVGGAELAAAIRQVRAAADADPASPLSGVLLDVAAGTVDAVATNRYWMAVRTVPLAGGATHDLRVVLALAEAASLCAVLDRHDRVTLEPDADAGVLRVAGRTWPVRPVAYPAHRMVLAGLPPASARLLLPRAELAAAIEAAGRAEVDLTLTADGVEVGGREVPGSVDVPGAVVRLGAALARRALDAALGPQVLLRVGTDAQPVRVTSPYQPGFLALVMPGARPAAER